jgi:hypothetical protein
MAKGRIADCSTAAGGTDAPGAAIAEVSMPDNAHPTPIATRFPAVRLADVNVRPAPFLFFMAMKDSPECNELETQ